MTHLLTTLALDVFLALLLGTTIFYCVKLNKRIRVLQDSKSELAYLIQQFDASTRQATISIQEIQKASKKINENIQAKLDKANYLADDLAFMIDRANKTADRMEGKTNTPKMSDMSRPSERKSAPTASKGKKSSLLSKSAGRNSDVIPPNNSARKGGLEAMMDRISELKGNPSSDAEGTRAKRSSTRVRTRSETDLMHALKRDADG